MFNKDQKIKPRQNPLVFENLEPRLLLSADVAALSELARESLQPAIEQQVIPEVPNETQSNVQTHGLLEASSEGNALYVIDSALQDSDILVNELQQQNPNLVTITPQNDLTVLRDAKQGQASLAFLNPAESGLVQLEQLLGGVESIDSIHIFSHGSAGQIQLGSLNINLANIDGFQQDLQKLGQSLSQKADILFYACDVTASEQGTVLIQKIADYTQADVAASDNKTGNTAFSDWKLETQVGKIEAKSVEIEGYQDVLANLLTSSDGVASQDAFGDTVFTITLSRDATQTNQVLTTVSLTGQNYVLDFGYITDLDPTQNAFSYNSLSGELIVNQSLINEQQDFAPGTQQTFFGAFVIDPIAASSNPNSYFPEAYTFVIDFSGGATDSPNSNPTGSVSITGTPTQGQTLSASNNLADADGLGSISYQWNRNGTAITGATNASYTLTQADVGTAISVSANYTDAKGTAESVTSTAITAIANINDNPTGTLAISGNLTEGQTITADTSTIADADGLGVFSYVWKAGGVVIAGATSNSYTLTQSEVGKTITLEVSYTDGQGTAESLSVTSNSTVANINDNPTGSVSIAGTPTQGQTLSASNNLADADGLGSISYQWNRNGTAITGATNASYTLTQADVGTAISVSANYTDAKGTAESVTSTAITAIANINDNPTGTLAISGNLTEGQTITADTSTIADADGLGVFSYVWKAGGVVIAGATSNSYTLTQSEVGKTITLEVSYTDGQGTAESLSVTSNSTVANINDNPTGSVSIAGTPTQGQTLSASNNLADADGLGSISYQWNRNGTAITGATNANYTLTQADVGTAISVSANYTDAKGTAESVTSTAITAIANINDNPTGTLAISGNLTEGQTITADTSTIADADGLGVFSYVWKAGGVVIAGATSNSYTLTQSEVGKTITLEVSYTDGQGTAESLSVTSNSTVANINDNPTGSVSIAGTPTQGQTLSASNNLADADGLGSISYQWNRNGTAITGATNASYTLTQADVGTAISVSANYTDAKGTAESVTSTAITAIANINDNPTGTLAISGNLTEGQTITADTSTIADADGLGVFSYVWKAGGVVIAGATSNSYTLTQSEVGKTITLEVSYTDGQGTAESLSVTSNQTVNSNVNSSQVAPIITSNGFGATASITIDQNTTNITTVTASDANDDSLSYSIPGGANAGLFTIDSQSGVLSMTPTAYDFSTGGKNIYEVIVQASDGSLVDKQTITVSVNEPQAAPAFTSGDFTISEGNTTVGTLTATDQNGDALSFTLAGGADKSQFNLTSTGILTFKSAPSFTNPTDVDKNNNYLLDVTVTDGKGGETTQSLTVTVQEVQEAPTVSSNGFVIGHGTTQVGQIQAQDKNGDTLSYQFAGGTHDDLFTLASDGSLSFNTAPTLTSAYGSTITQLDTQEFTIKVTVSDGQGSEVTKDLNIAVVDNRKLDWQQRILNTFDSLYGYQSSDQSFTVLDKTYPIFSQFSADQAPTDSVGNGDGRVSLTLKTLRDALASDELLKLDWVSFADGFANNQVAEFVQNRIKQAWLDGGYAWYLSDGSAENQLLSSAYANSTVEPSRNSVYWDFNIPIVSKVTDVTLSDAEMQPFLNNLSSDLNPDSLDGAMTQNLKASGLVVTQINFGLQMYKPFWNSATAQDQTLTLLNSYNSALDQSPGITLSSQIDSISGDIVQKMADGSSLVYQVSEYSASSQNKDLEKLNYNWLRTWYGIYDNTDSTQLELNRGENGNHSFYMLKFTLVGSNTDTASLKKAWLSDGGKISTVLKVENSVYKPIIGSNGAGDVASVSVDQTATTITKVTATSSDTTDSFFYAITGGKDQNLFTIDLFSGDLTLKSPQTYNFDGNNSYEVIVKAQSNKWGFYDEQTLTVNINEPPMAPEFTSGNFTIEEGETAVGFITAKDLNKADVLSYRLTANGVDNSAFSLDSSTGALSFKNTAIPNKKYQIEVEVTDGTFVVQQNLTVSVISLTDVVDKLGQALTIQSSQLTDKLSLLGASYDDTFDNQAKIVFDTLQNGVGAFDAQTMNLSGFAQSLNTSLQGLSFLDSQVDYVNLNQASGAVEFNFNVAHTQKSASTNLQVDLSQAINQSSIAKDWGFSALGDNFKQVAVDATGSFDWKLDFAIANTGTEAIGKILKGSKLSLGEQVVNTAAIGVSSDLIGSAFDLEVALDVGRVNLNSQNAINYETDFILGSATGAPSLVKTTSGSANFTFRDPTSIQTDGTYLNQGDLTVSASNQANQVSWNVTTNEADKVYASKFYDTLLGGMESMFSGVSAGVDGILSGVNLPFIGDVFDNEAKQSIDNAQASLLGTKQGGQYIDGLGKKMQDAGAEGKGPLQVLQEGIYAALSDVLYKTQDKDNDGVQDKDNLTGLLDLAKLTSADQGELVKFVKNGSGLVTGIEIDIITQQALDLGELDIDLASLFSNTLDVGLAAKLGLTADLKVANRFNLVFDLEQGVVLKTQGVIQDDNGNQDEMALVFDVHLKDSSEFKVDLGVLSGQMNGDSTDRLSGILGIDFAGATDDNDGWNITGLDSESLDVSARANLKLDAVFDTTVEAAGMVKVTSNTEVKGDWQSKLTTDGFDNSELRAPTVIMRDVTLNMGEFGSQVLKPMAEQMGVVLEPMKPVMDALATELDFLPQEYRTVASFLDQLYYQYELANSKDKSNLTQKHNFAKLLEVYNAFKGFQDTVNSLDNSGNMYLGDFSLNAYVLEDALQKLDDAATLFTELQAYDGVNKSLPQNLSAQDLSNLEDFLSDWNAKDIQELMQSLQDNPDAVLITELQTIDTSITGMISAGSFVNSAVNSIQVAIDVIKYINFFANNSDSKLAKLATLTTSDQVSAKVALVDMQQYVDGMDLNALKNFSTGDWIDYILAHPGSEVYQAVQQSVTGSQTLIRSQVETFVNAKFADIKTAQANLLAYFSDDVNNPLDIYSAISSANGVITDTHLSEVTIKANALRDAINTLFSGNDLNELVREKYTGINDVSIAIQAKKSSIDAANNNLDNDTTPDAVKEANKANAQSFSDKLGQYSSSEYGSDGGNVHVDIPLLTGGFTPIYNLLTNETTDLVTLAMEKKNASGEYEPDPLEFTANAKIEIPIINPILNAHLGGDFGAQLMLGFGLDSSGFLEWKESGYSADKIADVLLKGFYISDNIYRTDGGGGVLGNGETYTLSKTGLTAQERANELTAQNLVDMNELELQLAIEAGVSVGVAGLVEAGVTGGISSEANFNLNDTAQFASTEINDTTLVYDGKLYLNEMGMIIAKKGVECLFDVQAQAEAFLEAFIWIGVDLGFYDLTLFEENIEFLRVELFSIEHHCDVTVERPYKLADLDPTTKELKLEYYQTAENYANKDKGYQFQGPYVYQVDLEQNTKHNLVVDGNVVEENKESDWIVVRANGFTEYFEASRVNKISTAGSDNDDRFHFQENLSKIKTFGKLDGVLKLDIKTGAGNDFIRIDAGGAGLERKLDAGTGNDSIRGSDGEDSIDGGAGDDVIWGNAGKDTLKGSDGNDRIVSGSGKNTLYGGRGDDRIYLSSDKMNATVNTAYGEAGDDKFMLVSSKDGEATNIVSGGGGVDSLLLQAKRGETEVVDGQSRSVQNTVEISKGNLNGETRLNIDFDGSQFSLGQTSSIENVDISTAEGADTIKMGDLNNVSHILTALNIDLGNTLSSSTGYFDINPDLEQDQIIVEMNPDTNTNDQLVFRTSDPLASTLDVNKSDGSTQTSSKTTGNLSTQNNETSDVTFKKPTLELAYEKDFVNYSDPGMVHNATIQKLSSAQGSALSVLQKGVFPDNFAQKYNTKYSLDAVSFVGNNAPTSLPSFSINAVEGIITLDSYDPIFNDKIYKVKVTVDQTQIDILSGTLNVKASDRYTFDVMVYIGTLALPQAELVLKDGYFKSDIQSVAITAGSPEIGTAIGVNKIDYYLAIKAQDKANKNLAVANATSNLIDERIRVNTGYQILSTADMATYDADLKNLFTINGEFKQTDYDVFKSGGDASLFNIDSSGQLTFKQPPGLADKVEDNYYYLTVMQKYSTLEVSQDGVVSKISGANDRYELQTVVVQVIDNMQINFNYLSGDALTVKTYGGNDVVDLSGIKAEGYLGNIKVESGAGNDEIIGSIFNEVIDSGAGNDRVKGSYGNDQYSDVSGNDTFIEDRENYPVENITADLTLKLTDTGLSLAENNALNGLVANHTGKLVLEVATTNSQKIAEIEQLILGQNVGVFSKTVSGQVFLTLTDTNFMTKTVYGYQDVETNNLVFEVLFENETDMSVFENAQITATNNPDYLNLQGWSKDITVDGRGNADTYSVLLQPNNTASTTVNIDDSGIDSGLDILNIYGGKGNDTFAAKVDENGQGFIAAYSNNTLAITKPELSNKHTNESSATQGDLSGFERRINYGGTTNTVSNLGADDVRVFMGSGNDTFVSYDTAKKIEVNGEAGNDSFLIGVITKVKEIPHPQFPNDTSKKLVVIDIGGITKGVSYNASFYGGSGEDYFEINRNAGEVDLFGESGNDLFYLQAHLILTGETEKGQQKTTVVNKAATIAVKLSEKLKDGSYDSKDGELSGQDAVVNSLALVNNNAVRIDGGSGFDALAIGTTPLDDTIYIYTEMEKDALGVEKEVLRIYGAGIQVKEIKSVERIVLITGSGDDTIYVNSLRDSDWVEIFTGQGNDQVMVGGAAQEFETIIPPSVKTFKFEIPNLTFEGTTTSGNEAFTGANGDRYNPIQLDTAMEAEAFKYIRGQLESYFLQFNGVKDFKVLSFIRPDKNTYLNANYPNTKPGDLFWAYQIQVEYTEYNVVSVKTFNISFNSVPAASDNQHKIFVNIETEDPTGVTKTMPKGDLKDIKGTLVLNDEVGDDSLVVVSESNSLSMMGADIYASDYSFINVDDIEWNVKYKNTPLVNEDKDWSATNGVASIYSLLLKSGEAADNAQHYKDFIGEVQARVEVQNAIYKGEYITGIANGSWVASNGVEYPYYLNPASGSAIPEVTVPSADLAVWQGRAYFGDDPALVGWYNETVAGMLKDYTELKAPPVDLTASNGDITLLLPDVSGLISQVKINYEKGALYEGYNATSTQNVVAARENSDGTFKKIGTDSGFTTKADLLSQGVDASGIKIDDAPLIRNTFQEEVLYGFKSIDGAKTAETSNLASLVSLTEKVNQQLKPYGLEFDGKDIKETAPSQFFFLYKQYDYLVEGKQLKSVTLFSVNNGETQEVTVWDKNSTAMLTNGLLDFDKIKQSVLNSQQVTLGSATDELQSQTVSLKERSAEVLNTKNQAELTKYYMLPEGQDLTNTKAMLKNSFGLTDTQVGTLIYGNKLATYLKVDYFDIYYNEANEIVSAKIVVTALSDFDVIVDKSAFETFDKAKQLSYSTDVITTADTKTLIKGEQLPSGVRVNGYDEVQLISEYDAIVATPKVTQIDNDYIEGTAQPLAKVKFNLVDGSGTEGRIFTTHADSTGKWFVYDDFINSNSKIGQQPKNGSLYVTESSLKQYDSNDRDITSGRTLPLTVYSAGTLNTDHIRFELKGDAPIVWSDNPQDQFSVNNFTVDLSNTITDSIGGREKGYDVSGNEVYLPYYNYQYTIGKDTFPIAISKNAHLFLNNTTVRDQFNLFVHDDVAVNAYLPNAAEKGSTYAELGNKDDYIIGGTGKDVIYGGGGNDIILSHATKSDGYTVNFNVGGGGEDVFNGEAGNDIISGGGTTHTHSGYFEKNNYGGVLLDANGDANIFTFGNTNTDSITVYGGAGNDTILGRAGDDYLDGGDGADWIYGNAGNDMIYTGLGDDHIYGGSGDDWLYGAEGTKNGLMGGSGNDWIYSKGASDTILGEGGDDYIETGDGDDTVYGGLGNDYIKAEGGNDVVYGDDTNHSDFGDDGDDVIISTGGFDYFHGGKGNDTLTNGLIMVGGFGNDVLTNDRDFGDKVVIMGGDDLSVGGGDTYGIITSNMNYQGYPQFPNGADTLENKAGVAILMGGDGEDKLSGVDDDDLIFQMRTSLYASVPTDKQADNPFKNIKTLSFNREYLSLFSVFSQTADSGSVSVALQMAEAAKKTVSSAQIKTIESRAEQQAQQAKETQTLINILSGNLSLTQLQTTGLSTVTTFKPVVKDYTTAVKLNDSPREKISYAVVGSGQTKVTLQFNESGELLGFYKNGKLVEKGSEEYDAEVKRIQDMQAEQEKTAKNLQEQANTLKENVQEEETSSTEGDESADAKTNQDNQTDEKKSNDDSAKLEMLGSNQEDYVASLETKFTDDLSLSIAVGGLGTVGMSNWRSLANNEVGAQSNMIDKGFKWTKGRLSRKL